MIIGNVYRFSPDKTSFNMPVKVEIKYDINDLPEGYDEENLVIAYFDESKLTWRGLPSSKVDIESKTIEAYTTHFSDYGIPYSCGNVNWEYMEYDYGKVFNQLLGDEESCKEDNWVEEKHGDYDGYFHEKEKNSFPDILEINKPTKYQTPGVSIVPYVDNPDGFGYVDLEKDDMRYFYRYYEDTYKEFKDKDNLLNDYITLPKDWDEDDGQNEGICFDWIYESDEERVCDIKGSDTEHINDLRTIEPNGYFELRSKWNFFKNSDGLIDNSCQCKDSSSENDDVPPVHCECDIATYSTFGYLNKKFEGMVKLPIFVPNHGSCIMENDDGVLDIIIEVEGSKGDLIGYKENDLTLFKRGEKIKEEGSSVEVDNLYFNHEDYNTMEYLGFEYSNLDRLNIEESKIKDIRNKHLMDDKTEFKAGMNYVYFFLKNKNDDACLWADATIKVRGTKLWFDKGEVPEEYCHFSKDADYCYKQTGEKKENGNYIDECTKTDSSKCYKVKKSCETGGKLRENWVSCDSCEDVGFGQKECITN
jgi:hypothetical protein